MYAQINRFNEHNHNYIHINRTRNECFSVIGFKHMQSALTEAHSADQQYRFKDTQERSFREKEFLHLHKSYYVADVTAKKDKYTCDEKIFISFVVEYKVSTHEKARPARINHA